MHYIQKFLFFSLFLCALLGGSNYAFGQALDDYRSVITGNWNTTATWQRYNGSAWVAAAASPNSGSNVITIRNGHTVTVTAAVTVDQVIVDAGGQVTVNSGQTLTIANGAGTDMTIDGDLVNSGTITTTGTLVLNSGSTLDVGTSLIDGSDGTFTLSSGAGIITANTGGLSTSGATGSIQVSGTRTYSAGASYTYNGTAAQVTGNGLAGANNLTINNSGGVTLTSSVTISGTLNLTNGILTTDTNTITVTNNSSTAVSGGSVTSFIAGPLIWQLATGTTYSFLVGAGTTYLPFGITGMTGTAPRLRVQAYTGSTGGSAGSPLLTLSTTEYWQASVVSGTYSGGSVSLTRQSSLNEMAAIGRNTTTLNGVYTSLSGTVNGTSIINSNSTGASLGYFVMASLTPTPGGVLGASIWLKADVGVTTGATFTWADQSGNNRNGVQTTAANQPTVTGNSINFNPALTFDGTNDRLVLANLTGLPIGAAQAQEFAVARNLNTGGPWAHILAYGTSADNQVFSLGKNTNNANAVAPFFTSNVTSTALEYTDGAPVLSDAKYTGTQGVISSFGVQRATLVFTGAKTINAGRVGCNVADGSFWDGDISEVVLFPTNLTTTQVSQVNSYLAIKYGITIDQSSAQNYIASDGSTIFWNGTTNSSYKNNITGISRDDYSALNQKQSKSVNSGLQVVVGNGNTIATDNATNSNNFSADKSALVWGDNAGSVAAWTTTGAPSSRQIVARTWKVQETGTVGSVKVQIADNSGTNGLPAENTNVYLLVDADGNFASGATETTMTLNGTNWEANVDLTNGQFFTFATQAAASTPGGVTGAIIWLKADAGTSTTTNGSGISTWTNQTGGGNGIQATAGNQPTYQTGTTDMINFNPVVRFNDANSQFFDLSANIFGDGTARTAANMFVLSKNSTLLTDGSILMEKDASGNRVNEHLPWNSSVRIYWDAGSTTTAERLWVDIATSGINTTTPFIWSFLAQSTAQSIKRDGYTVATNGAANISYAFTNEADNRSIGRGTGTPSEYYGGNIGEIIGYGTSLTATQTRQIESYLAIKYGKTLDQTSAQNYIASDGTTVYWNGTTNSGYKNNIAGIACDDYSTLNQKQSRSVNTNLQVVVGNGNTIATDNISNTNSFSSDKSALVWGDNAGSVAAWTATGAPTNYYIVARTWKIQETGSVGSVKVQIADNSGSNGLPAENNTVYLLADADGNFVSGATLITMSLNGTNWEGNVDFTNGQFFTFATDNCAPAIGIPVFALGSTSTRCQGVGTVTYTATSTNSTGITYTLDAASITGGNSIVAGTGAVTYVAGWSGTSIITASAAGCNGPQTAIHTVTIIGDLTWNGSVSPDWNVPGNWSCGFVPYLTTNVLIPNVANKPVLSSGAVGTVKNIVIDAGSSLTVTGNTMQISGTITNNGTFTATAGAIEMKGTIAQSIAAGVFESNTVMDLIISNAAGVTLAGALNVTGIVTANENLASGGNLTLVSTAAQMALINGSGTGNISGNITMQRYLLSGFGYKYFSSPFQGATVSEFGDDMNLAAPFPSFYRYDESRTTSGWVSYIVPAGVLNPMQGYAVNFGAVDAPNTVDVSGIVNNGALSVTLYNNNNTYTQGFNLVGNPYPSPIDWDAASGWTKTNINDALYYFKASTSDQYGGTYSTYINSISSDGAATKIIPSMQGFFIHVSDDTYPVTGTLSVNNNVRITDQTHPFLKSKGTTPCFLLRLAVRFTDDPGSSDPMVIYFYNKAFPGFDSKFDALKLMNTDLKVPNLYALLPGGTKLSIDALPEMADTILTVPLGLKTYKNGEISFRIRDIENLPPIMKIYLHDAITGIKQDLLPAKEYKINLTAGEYSNRFYLGFLNSTTDIPEVNPSSDFFSVYSSNGIIKANVGSLEGREGVIYIFNLLGRQVFNKKVFNEGYYEFDPQVITGIYFVSFITGNVRDTKKIFILSK